jgi:hypothetical protein
MDIQEIIRELWGLFVAVFVTGGVVGYYINRLIDTGFADSMRKHNRKLYVKERVLDIVAEARSKLFSEDPADVQYIEKVILELRDLDDESGELFEDMLRSWQTVCMMKDRRGKWKKLDEDELLEKVIDQAKKTLILSDTVTDKLKRWK